MDSHGRCLGLIGGLGPGATVTYSRALVAAHAAQKRVARMMIAHADVDRVLALTGASDRDGLAQYLAGVIADLKAAGAELTAIVAVTPYICAPQLVPRSPLPLIDMVTEVARAVRQKGLTRIALFGTRFTVETSMFGRLEGIDIAMPRPDEITQNHNSYADIVADRHTPAQLDQLRELARTLIARDGAEVVLLAGTDLSTVFDEDNAGFPLLDCAGVHIAAIAKQMMASQ
ncbi:MAG: aspartate/glutamate racemase family protein [Alphaproteobacteria bacterium]|nr:aspartate/glutamate racemase family protein [Alphaproteobacteria bacterium]